jgi:hypothetical protein
VRRPVRAEQPVGRRLEAAALGPLLQRRLRVARRRGHALEQRRPLPLDEAPRGLEPAVEVERTDQGLAAVGEAGPLAAPLTVDLAARDLQQARQAQPLADLGHRGTLDERHLPVGEPALRVLREALEQHVRHDQAEHPVAQELEAARRSACGGRSGRSRSSGSGPRRAARGREAVAERRLQLLALPAARGAGRHGTSPLPRRPRRRQRMGRNSRS